MYRPLKVTLFSAIMASTLPLSAMAESPQEPVPPAPSAPFTRDLLDAHIREFLMDNPEVIIEALQVLKAREAAREAASDLALIEEHADELFSAAPGSTVVGNPNGTHTLVEFVDYQCGYCKQMHPVVTAMLEADPELRVIFKEFPILGPQSVLASKIQIAVARDLGPDYYKPLADVLFEMRGTITTDSIPSILEGIDLPEEKATALSEYLTRELATIEADPELTAALERNAILGRSLNISGTPGFIGLSGIIRGAASPDRLSAIAAPDQ